MDLRKHPFKKNNLGTCLYKHTVCIALIISLLAFVLPSSWISILVLYFMISEIALYKPELIHEKNKRKFHYSKEPFGFYFGAHRGGSMEGLENTLSKFFSLSPPHLYFSQFQASKIPWSQLHRNGRLHDQGRENRRGA